MQLILSRSRVGQFLLNLARGERRNSRKSYCRFGCAVVYADKKGYSATFDEASLVLESNNDELIKLLKYLPSSN